MATLTVSPLNHGTGLLDLAGSAVAADAALADKWLNPNGTTFLYVDNAGASPCVVTMAWGAPPAGSYDGNIAAAARTFSVGTGKRALLGPFGPTSLFNDTNGFANVSYSQVSSVKILAIQLGS